MKAGQKISGIEITYQGNIGKTHRFVGTDGTNYVWTATSKVLVIHFADGSYRLMVPGDVRKLAGTIKAIDGKTVRLIRVHTEAV